MADEPGVRANPKAGDAGGLARLGEDWNAT